jgi:hypothetical protein
MMFRGLSDIEGRRYRDWRRNHNCLSQVEISYIPDEVDQTTKIRCLKCNETIVVTDFSCA